MPTPALVVPSTYLCGVKSKSSLNDSSFLSVKIWSTMSVAIPACKFEEWGDVDENEGQ